ncbi:MAG: hypothetical protein ACE37M_10715 [Henriciella sp.]
MRLVGIDRVEARGLTQYRAEYESRSGRPFRLHFTLPSLYKAPENQDAFFVVGITLAMILREDYEQSIPVSKSLLHGVRQTVKKWCSWHSFLKQIKIKTPTRLNAQTADSHDDRVNASFFTGGVDSLFTTVNHPNEIGGLISIAHSSADFEEIEHTLANLRGLSGFAAQTDRKHFVIATNVMTLAPEMLDTWSWLSHGAALAAVAHSLSGEITNAIISSSDTWETLVPWGSHPDVDRLFSNESVTMEHYGNDFGRTQKTERIAADASALSTLSVCHHGRAANQEIVNCSKCAKCIRTMITLDLAGASPAQSTTFDWSHYRLEAIRDFRLTSEDDLVFFDEISLKCEQEGRSDLAAAVKSMTRGSNTLMILKKLETYLRRRIPVLAQFRPVLVRCRNAIYRSFKITTNAD